MQAMKGWHTQKPELFKKQPYLLMGCDTYGHGRFLLCKASSRPTLAQRCRQRGRPPHRLQISTPLQTISAIDWRRVSPVASAERR